ncbi:MAG TPA: hypothetical protein PK263_02890 [bacterium]|nr:hypothetical protein [bacterium]
MDEQDTKDIFINPYYAITISPSLAGDHEPMVSKEEWVKVNLKLIDELGEEAWLKELLRVLESGKSDAQSMKELS